MIQAVATALYVTGSVYALVQQALGSESSCGVEIADRLMPLGLAVVGGVVTLVSKYWDRDKPKPRRRRRRATASGA